MDRIKLFNIKLDNVNLDEAASRVIHMAKIKDSVHYVVTPNVDHIMKLQNDLEFKKVYDHASLVVADGQPLIWASKILKTPLKEKVSGSDLFPRVCEKASVVGLRIFFLGGNDGVATQAAENLKKRYKNLNIVGTYSPSRGFEQDKNATNSIVTMINSASPDILFVGVGAPKQEKWIFNNLYKLKVPVSLGIGASFDFEAGNIKRAPKLMQNLGLEWFWRFCHEPRRLFKRYFFDDMKFIFLLMKEIYYKRINSKENC